MDAIDMTGKVCLITGAASGMGRIAARELAKMGATLFLCDRELEEGQNARDDIVRLSGNDRIEFYGCDVSSFAQVNKMAAHFLSRYDACHVLINNAGLTNPEYQLSEEGHEYHMATMHLGHVLLTELLLECLKQSAPSRIIQISSDAHKSGPGIDFDDMTCEKAWKGKRYSNSGAFAAYHRAKLAMVYATYELAEELDGSGVTINAVSPGYFVGTNVFRHMRGIMKLGVKLVRPFFTDPERAAQTYLFLATSPDVEGVSGKYWEYCKEKATSDLSYDVATRKRLWQWTQEILYSHGGNGVV